jgi:hypothetical protein
MLGEAHHPDADRGQDRVADGDEQLRLERAAEHAAEAGDVVGDLVVDEADLGVGRPAMPRWSFDRSSTIRNENSSDNRNDDA